VAPVAPQNGRLQIQSTRIQGQLFANGAVPAAFNPAASATHDLMISSYYVAADSALIPGVPTLRRKSLASAGGAPLVVDQEVAPGVENMQLQFGVDVDADNTVDRYVNPGDPILTPGDPAFLPAAQVITARIWIVVRSIDTEVGIDDQRDYEPGDVDLGVPNDEFRRMIVSKTILLRNTRT
jgi:type IV pilus assembly protein PilW